MSTDQPQRASSWRLSAAPRAALVTVAALLTATPAAASSALFFPRGSDARVDRHHVTVALSATGAVTWDAVDIKGGAADVGVLVAVKAGGRVEITARAWIDAIEEATGVIVSTVPSAECTPIAPRGASASGQAEAGASLSASGEASGGCSGSGSSRTDGGGGCVSNSSSPSGGCGSAGCGSCAPTENGHPGCSAFATPTSGCGPLDNGSSGGTTTLPDGAPGALPRVGPYELVKVSAADGSAARWLEANDYEPGASFDQAAAAIERDGYELFAVRARSATPSSVVRSLRVITTSPSPALPARLWRMGSNNTAATPVTLVALASAPQALADTAVMSVDEAKLAWTGSTSSYESLASGLLGDVTASDAAGGGPSSSRWLFESARSVSNRSTARDGSAGDGGAVEAETLADLFRAKCGARAPVKHAVCPGAEDGGDGDAGIVDAAADVDPGDAADDAATADGGAGDDAGASDASDGAGDDASAPVDCPEIDRQSCDDIDLAFGPSSALVATRFRGLVGGDPAQISDLVFRASAEVLAEGRYVVRDDGQPGLCQPTSATSLAESDGDAQTCTQTAARPRSWASVNLGPLVMFLAVIRAVAAIMGRARSRR